MYNLIQTITLQFGGDSLGTQLKIGELADKAQVTKRTIDHYTRLGLLEAKRSASNYRYYDSSATAQIGFIERRKSEGLSLEEIKRELVQTPSECTPARQLKHRIENLEKEVSELFSNLEKSDAESLAEAKKDISPASLSLIRTLLLLLH